MSQKEIFEKLRKSNPYETITAENIPAVVTGWPTQDDEPIRRYCRNAKVIVEVGSFLGRSVILMAKENPDAIFYCVDTWLGGPEIQIDADTIIKYGRPNYYERFLTNIIAAGISDRVFPICQTSTSAAVLLARWGIKANMIYIDGGHKYSECYNDLIHYSYILDDGGVFVVDDFEMGFYSVVGACQRFAYESGGLLSQEGETKCSIKLDNIRIRSSVDNVRIRVWPGVAMDREVRMICIPPSPVV